MLPEEDTSSLYSLSDSVRQSLYRHQGERRLQDVNDDYYWPCDSAAVELELSIAALGERVYKNGLYWESQEGELAKVLKGAGSILDLVVGIDLVPTDLSYLPANLSIEVHDLLEGLPYPDDSFDLIHARALSTTSLFDTANAVLSDIQRVLRPGGILILEHYEDSYQPFYTRSEPNPHLDLLEARHRLRMDLIARTPEAISRLRWGSRMADEVRQTHGFRVEDGGTVVDIKYEVPVGRESGTDAAERQTGSVHERIWMALWEMHGVSLGMSEEMIEESRQLDEMVLENAVGVFANLRVVWAVNGRS